MVEPMTQDSDSKTPDQKTKFALLADGYAKDLFTTGLILQRLGYDIYIANTAEDALKIIDVAMPALIISELVLPNMSGLELLVRIKHSTESKSIPFIIHTALDDPKREELCRASGCSAILKKPANPSALYSAIQQATEQTPRRHIRLRTLLPVRIGGTPASETVGTEFVSALSEDGIFVRTLSPRPVGSILPVTIMIHSIPVKLKATVLRSITINPGVFKEPGMAMKFADITATDRELLRNFILGQIMKDVPSQ